MDSSNVIDLHQQSEEPFFLHGSIPSYSWSQDSLLNGIELIPTINTPTLSSSRDEQHIIDQASFANSYHMFQDLGFQRSLHGQRSMHQIHQAKIKEELSLESFLKLQQYKLSSAVKHEEQTQLHHDFNSNYQPSHPQLVHENMGFDPLCFGMLLPSMETSSTTMDIEALDMLESTRFGRISPCQSFNINSTTFFDNMSYGYPHQLHSSVQGGFINLQEIQTSANELTEGKRENCSNLDHLKPSKKSRFDSRPSLPPFKVRKEKLGDRIAALQQLVAPFGKTDTASVLMEAIGYIKFLQDQVETLSVPYMRPSNKKKLGTTEEVSIANQREDLKPDLRSRGLCLVPLSCTGYVTNDNVVWSPSNFR